MLEDLLDIGKDRDWVIVPLLPEKGVIGSKWVYKVKTRSDGFLDCYKAKLVTKGYTQEYGVDYQENFPHVV